MSRAEHLSRRAPDAADAALDRLPKARARGAQAVMAAKRAKISAGTAWEELELFPTPPWATRALFEHVLPVVGVRCERLGGPPYDRPRQTGIGMAWEPCAGLGHMSAVLFEYVPIVMASDVHAYTLADGRTTLDAGLIGGTGNFCDEQPGDPCWIITNPPFGEAAKMARHALALGGPGVAFLLRLQWLETEAREHLFRAFPPSLVAVFSRRVPMCEGGYDPDCDTATAYAWFVWVRDPYDGTLVGPARDFRNAGVLGFETMVIPYRCKEALWRDSDRALAARHVPGWVPPSVLKKAGKQQMDLLT